MNSILKIENITKEYPGVLALNQVSMEFQPGEIHALMGENGAGKSTLIKIISGAIKPDSGKIIIDGESFSEMSPALSKSKGIGVIYQEFNIVPSLSVVENIFLGERIGGKITADFDEMKRRSEALFASLGIELDVNQLVGSLSTAQQQAVEIAKAMSKEAKVLIMDEPSASLSANEVKHMLELVMRLKEKGVTIIYISHRMDEVFQISDRVTIMRDGGYVGTRNIGDITRKELITMMVGRELNETFPIRNCKEDTVVLEAKNLHGNGDHHINFKLHKGEILGIAGLVGAGRTELAKLLFGGEKIEQGQLFIKGKEVTIKSPGHAVKLGIGLIPEDRKNEGAHLGHSIEWNIGIMSMKKHSRYGVLKEKELRKQAEKMRDDLCIKTPNLEQLVKNLSGGNQQKVVLAKVLAAETDIIIFDEPTRGIDVGAKQEIYELMNELVSKGVSIIMISSEMEELIGMSDRIIVMRDGTIVGGLEKEDFEQRQILELASGI